MFVSSTLLAVLSLTVLVSVRAVHSQSKPKAAKAVVAAAPASYGNVDSISDAEMKIYLYFLASDQLEGRNLPSRGFDTAALYVASHLAEWGFETGNHDGRLVRCPSASCRLNWSKQVVAGRAASITAPPAGGRGRGGGGGGANWCGPRPRRGPRTSSTPRLE
jgi:hypothetical protein